MHCGWSWILDCRSCDLVVLPALAMPVYPWSTKHFAGPCNIHACLGPAGFDLFLDILFGCQRELVKILVLCSFIYYHCFRAARLKACLRKIFVKVKWSFAKIRTQWSVAMPKCLKTIILTGKFVKRLKDLKVLVSFNLFLKELI